MKFAYQNKFISFFGGRTHGWNGGFANIQFMQLIRVLIWVMIKTWGYISHMKKYTEIWNGNPKTMSILSSQDRLFFMKIATSKSKDQFARTKEIEYFMIFP